MQLHTLKRTHKNKKTRQIGRAGQRGKTSGRGTKGQNARAGHKKRPEIRDFIKRIPKMRGRGKNLNTSVQVKAFAVNLRDINLAFVAGDTVSPLTLQSKGLIANNIAKVKILGTGTLDKKVTIESCEVSASARLAIEKAGGTIK
ncbi:MAG: large subunit ribosomal protein [Patescibacteria group bacterium]|nr:large subunit ribosomal protein [Patescibacteria group bacterium]